MKKLLMFLLCTLFLASAASADTVVVNFDNLPSDPFGAVVPAGYGGMNWDTNFGVWSTCCAFSSHSGQNALLGNRIGTGVANMTMDFQGRSVIFDGAWMSGNGNATFTLFLGGNQVGVATTVMSGTGSVFFSSNYSGFVDAVVLNASRGSFVMDDVTYENTPEPASLALLGSGLIGLGGIARRKFMA